MSNAPTSRPRRFLLPLVFVLIFVGVCRASASEPPTVSPETTVFVEPLTPDGKAVDFRKIYETAQDDWLGPPCENGFRELLAAFGPRILEQDYLADSVRWEDFPTNPDAKDWFNGDWTRLCEKFELGPTARPTFVDRPDLLAYLRAAEPNALDKVNSDFERLRAAPWTADEFPTAARWLDENADRFDVYKKAINAPKLGCPHFPDDEPAIGWAYLLVPDVFALRFDVAYHLAIRANFRIGSGDVDGAISDRRLILRLSRHILDNPNNGFTESVIGLKVFEFGVGLNVAGNPNALPTAEQLARDAENWRETFGEYDFDAAFRRAVEGDRFLRQTAFALEWAALPASKKIGALRELANISRDDFFQSGSRLEPFQSFLAFWNFDADAFALKYRELSELWANQDETLDDLVKPLDAKDYWTNPQTRSEAAAVLVAAATFGAIDAVEEAFRRAEQAAKSATDERAAIR